MTTTTATNSNENATFIKIAFKDELRRVAFATERGLTGLQETCCALFALKAFAPFQLTYKDAEGDTLILSSTEELNQLIDGGKTPKLSLVARKAAPIRFGMRALTPATPIAPETPASEDVKQAQPDVEQVAPQPVTVTTTVTVTATEETQPKAPKKSFKEKRDILKTETANTKVVRLRWRQANPNYKPQEAQTENEKERGNWRQKKLASKGCYVGATFKGKIKFNSSIGRKSLWFCHELTNGDRMFAPLCAPFRFLRVHADGTVDLSNAGIGQRTRWGFAPLTGFGGRLVSRSAPNLQLAAVSVGKKKMCQNEFKKERVGARGLDLTTSAPENLLSSEFAIEEVDPIQILKWMAIRKAWKKRAHHHAKKEHKKHAKHSKKFEARQAFLSEHAHPHGHGHHHRHAHPHDGAHAHPHAHPHPHPHAHAHAQARHCHWRHNKDQQASPVVVEAVPVPIVEQQPQQDGAAPQPQVAGPHPYMMRPFARPPGLFRHHHRHGPFNV